MSNDGRLPPGCTDNDIEMGFDLQGFDPDETPSEEAEPEDDPDWETK